MNDQASDALAEVLITPGRRPLTESLRELVASADLVWILARRDVRVRYAQTLLGGAWAILQPAVMLLLLSFVFGSVLKVPRGLAPVPYPVLVLVGVVAWTFFSQGALQSGGGILSAQALVTKVYFSRLAIPLSKVLAAMVDLAVGAAFLTLLLIWNGTGFRRQMLCLPFLFLGLVFLTVAVGICLSVLTVRFRDVSHTLPFLSQVGLYASPIAYPAALVPPHWRPMYYINPVAGVVEALRWSLLGTDLDGVGLIISIAVATLLFLLGLALFQRVDPTVADVV